MADATSETGLERRGGFDTLAPTFQTRASKLRPARAHLELVERTALVDALEEKDGVGPSRALELYCLMILNLNEFAYLD